MPSTDEKELFLINEYDPELLDKAPITEKDLMTMYSKHSDNLYLYLQETINPFILPLSNELRAMLGLIATYRVLTMMQLRETWTKRMDTFADSI